MGPLSADIIRAHESGSKTDLNGHHDVWVEIIHSVPDVLHVEQLREALADLIQHLRPRADSISSAG